MARYLLLLVLSVWCSPVPASSGPELPRTEPPASPPATPGVTEEPPEGYYAFVESPDATPPRVRPPPYRQSPAECGGVHSARPHVSADNLCGDLNRGLVPKNPLGRNPAGEPYPFELIRNHTLKFLSRTLPVLRADDTLPRVAHLSRGDTAQSTPHTYPRSQPAPTHTELLTNHVDEPRDSRKFCDGGGVFCMLYRAINGESGSVSVNTGSGPERREDPGVAGPHQPPRYEGPPTPCPARVEYATPVFARNYQGVWRYVVQIPYEGYFTQTVEVTRCVQARCHYLDGGCLSSPRWLSLLVAELHYPDVLLETTSQPDLPADYHNYQQFLQKRAGQPSGDTSPATSPTAPHCDGHDDLGCYQVRLYYDWFLVPGSCKCWRPDYFARYVRRSSLPPHSPHSTDL